MKIILLFLVFCFSTNHYFDHAAKYYPIRDTVYPGHMPGTPRDIRIYRKFPMKQKELSRWMAAGMRVVKVGASYYRVIHDTAWLEPTTK